VAKNNPASALINWAKKYPLAPRYRTAHRLTLLTADGIRLAAVGLEGPPEPVAAVVLVHGFLNWSRSPRMHAFAHRLAPHVGVIVPDLRGHGRSDGISTVGHHEALDVEAAVALARQHWPGVPVVTIGASLGAAAVLVHAGTAGRGTVDAVVAISAPAWWGSVDSEGTNRLRRWTSTPTGRRLLAAVVRTRVIAEWDPPDDPADAVAGIAPARLILVHDPDDWYFSGEHAERLYERALEPKELWWYPGGGHGSDLLTAELADRVLAAITPVARQEPSDAP
jgi:pimeloyl-ACP methyl ester carboxylesterase